MKKVFRQRSTSDTSATAALVASSISNVLGPDTASSLMTPPKLTRSISARQAPKYECENCLRTFTNKFNHQQHLAKQKCTRLCEINHEHVLVREMYPNEELARQYFYNKRLDSVFSMRSSEVDRILYQCRKGVLLKDNDCPAYLRICHIVDKTKSAGDLLRNSYVIEGCLAHNHAMDPKYQKLAKIDSDKVKGLIRSGMSTKEIYQRYFSLPDVLDLGSVSRPVTHKDIDSIKTDMEESEKGKRGRLRRTSLADYLQWDSIVGYDLSAAGVDGSFQGKSFVTEGSMAIMFMSPEQRDRLAKFPRLLALALCPGEDNCPFMILTGLIMDARGDCSPVFHTVIQSFTASLVATLISRLKEINAQAVSELRYLHCNKFDSKTAQDVLVCSQKVLEQRIRLVYDSAVFDTCVERNYVDLKGVIRYLQMLPDKESFEKEFRKLYSSEAHSKDGRAFFENFGTEGKLVPCAKWAKCYNPVMLTGNFGIPMFQRCYKHVLVGGATLPKILLGIQEISTAFARKDILNVLEISGKKKLSSMQERFQRCHVDAREYQVTKKDDINFLVCKLASPAIIKPPEGVMVRKCHEPLCNPQKCQVNCEDCPKGHPCAHYFVCSCETFIRLRYCSHLHVVIACYKEEAGKIENVPQDTSFNEAEKRQSTGHVSVSNKQFLKTKYSAIVEIKNLLREVEECQGGYVDQVWLENVLSTVKPLRK